MHGFLHKVFTVYCKDSPACSGCSKAVDKANYLTKRADKPHPWLCDCMLPGDQTYAWVIALCSICQCQGCEYLISLFVWTRMQLLDGEAGKKHTNVAVSVPAPGASPLK